MQRTVLIACLPCLAALAVACVLLVLLLRLSGCRLDVSRLRALHGCEVGGVQSLSFVLTLPIFVMLMLFIVQVSQLAVGLMVVHYAAFAAARAAVVWLPADLGPPGVSPGNRPERENVIDGQVAIDGSILRVLPGGAPDSVKYQRIQAAAVLACAPMCPSRDLQRGEQLPQWVTEAQRVQVALYPMLVPTSQNNNRIPTRLRNKLAYSYQNTAVVLEWMEAPHPQKDVEVAPTYNPRGHPDPDVPPWNPREVGWEDPVTVRVVHRFALLPGPGRFLARQLVPADGSIDNVSQIIDRNQGQYTETVYTTDITASATLVNEGFKSVIPYVQQVP